MRSSALAYAVLTAVAVAGAILDPPASVTVGAVLLVFAGLVWAHLLPGASDLGRQPAGLRVAISVVAAILGIVAGHAAPDRFYGLLVVAAAMAAHGLIVASQRLRRTGEPS